MVISIRALWPLGTEGTLSAVRMGDWELCYGPGACRSHGWGVHFDGGLSFINAAHTAKGESQLCVQTDRQTRGANRQTDRQIERPTDILIDRFKNG